MDRLKPVRFIYFSLLVTIIAAVLLVQARAIDTQELVIDENEINEGNLDSDDAITDRDLQTVPTLAPTIDYSIAEGQYCDVISSTTYKTLPLKSGSCYFGTDETWSYLGEGYDNPLTGLTGCVPVVDLPPPNAPKALLNDENAMWCPGPNGLNADNEFDFSNATHAANWGLCSCVQCKIDPSATPSGFIQKGACHNREFWSFKFANGTIIRDLIGGQRVSEFPPFQSALRNVNTEGLWCPTNAGLDVYGLYSLTNPNTRGKWGMATCASTNFERRTNSPTVLETLQPSNQLTPRIDGAADGPIFDRIALFIQADYSGSIREGNARCRQDTMQPDGSSKSCWELQSDFISLVVKNISERFGGPENMRLHLSTFTCLNGNPVNRVLTKPALTTPGKLVQIESALGALRNQTLRRMYGTCPSLGAEVALKLMKKLPKGWPIAYFIVSDGRVGSKDDQKYRNAITRIKKQLPGQTDVCGVTIGMGLIPRLNYILRSDCLLAAADFVDIVRPAFVTRTARFLLGQRPAEGGEEEGGMPPNNNHPNDDNDGTDNNGQDDPNNNGDKPRDGDGSSRPSTFTGLDPMKEIIVLSASVGGFALVCCVTVLGVCMCRRRRRQQIEQFMKNPQKQVVVVATNVNDGSMPVSPSKKATRPASPMKSTTEKQAAIVIATNNVDEPVG